ncbi:hypothetical protein [Flavihumibacter fluvii]|uniref:hypothetical protein n=1 Tax=Flavihumibacter fluvii TaxID=2838157 RepID=UPI001BDF60C3|nr:hypothetical protein [Flavihumibacter fluvii]ULQ53534.1 hypothetical protein KJS93_04270 [Flavihumibacter fluvii]
MTNYTREAASFKDPSGFIFRDGGQVLRQVNQAGAGFYDLLMDSGLYADLIQKGWLISHQELPGHPGYNQNAYKILLPQQIPFISYPYEWSFDMLKDAALLTLKINQTAIQFGMVLKDASAYNIQFQSGKPLFIDTLSFEKYDARQPWIAYRQFCQHFLFPLLIVHYKGIDAQRWLCQYLDGIPVDITVRILPFSTRFRLNTMLHVHLQNKVSKQSAGNPDSGGFSKKKMIHLLTNLHEMVQDIKLPLSKTTWRDYYDNTILSKAYLKEKESVLVSYLSDLNICDAVDLGSNNGYFSQLLASRKIDVLAVDADYKAINDLYVQCKSDQLSNILPLIIDICNPPAGIGWMNKERVSFLNRCQASLVLALALVHHLYFTYNIPLPEILHFLNAVSTFYVIVEFVFIADKKVSIVSAGKESLIDLYTINNFEEACIKHFTIVKKNEIISGDRILYLLKKNN